MPRPNRDRVMVSFYIARAGKAAIRRLADDRGETMADTVRSMLAYAQQHMPKGWGAAREVVDTNPRARHHA